MDFRTRASNFVAQHRKRLAALAAVAGLVVVGAQLLRQLPTDTHIRYNLGEDHASVREVRVAFLHGDETTVRSLSRRFPNGAPESFDDTVSLTRGRYQVNGMVIDAEGVPQAFLRSIDVPSEGAIIIDLFDRAYAHAGP